MLKVTLLIEVLELKNGYRYSSSVTSVANQYHFVAGSIVHHLCLKYHLNVRATLA